MQRYTGIVLLVSVFNADVPVLLSAALKRTSRSTWMDKLTTVSMMTRRIKRRIGREGGKNCRVVTEI